MSKKLAIITGASQGIGKAVAFKLAELGYNLALISRSADKLEQVQTQIKQQYSSVEVRYYPLDIANNEQVKQAIAAIVKQHASIDVLFNNAGISLPGTSEIKPEDFENMVKVNLLGAFYVLHAVIPYMKQQRSGYIMNLASRSGKIARPQIGAYAASKFGLVGLNEALYKELVEFNIKVTAINPGFVDTPMTKNAKVANEDKIQPEDIADTVDYLLKLRPATFIKEVNIDCKVNVPT